MLKSTDRGATCRPARTGLRAYTALDVEVDPRRPDTLWLAAPGHSVYTDEGFYSLDYLHPGLFRSADGGRTWAQSDSGIFDDAIGQVVPDPALADRVWAFGTGRFYRSRDGGASWQGVAGLAVSLRLIAMRSSHSSKAVAAMPRV